MTTGSGRGFVGVALFVAFQSLIPACGDDSPDPDGNAGAGGDGARGGETGAGAPSGGNDPGGASQGGTTHAGADGRDGASGSSDGGSAGTTGGTGSAAVGGSLDPGQGGTPGGAGMTATGARGGAPAEGGTGGAPGSGGSGGTGATGGMAATGGTGTGGEDGIGAAGGAGGAADPNACLVAKDCVGRGQCVGSETALLCVRPSDVCSSAAECGRGETCDGYCRPAPGFGEHCSTSCRAPLWCHAIADICLPYTLSSPDCDLGSAQCPEGNECRPASIGSSRNHDCSSLGCDPQKCRRPFQVVSCLAFACAQGTYCAATDCSPNLAVGSACPPDETPSPIGVSFGSLPCEVGAYCGTGQEGAVCIRSPGEGEACVQPQAQAQSGHPTCTDAIHGGCSPCARGLYCGDDGVCRRAAQYGERCADRACDGGLRCASAIVDGTCTGGGTGGSGGAGGSGGDGGAAGGPSQRDCSGLLTFDHLALETAVRDKLSRTWQDLTAENVPYLSILEYQGDDAVGKLGGLECWTSLRTLHLSGSAIRDLRPLTSLSVLRILSIRRASLSDLRPLSGLHNLDLLDFTGNQIRDLQPLLDNPAVGAGDSLRVGANPIDCAEQSNVMAALRARGVTVSSDCPTRCDGSARNDVKEVSISGGSSCVVLTDGRVACWGDNAQGQLGNGSTVNSAAPAFVTGISTATDISLGGTQACAVLASGGVRCWGQGYLGSVAPSQSLTPVDVPGITDAVQVSVGLAVCVRLGSGGVTCWGGRGVLADPMPLPVPNIASAIDIAVDAAGACSVLADGTMQCWESTTTDTSSNPVPIPSVSGALRVSRGGITCALLAAGSAQCWANDAVPAMKTKAPEVIELPGSFALTTGSQTSCAVANDGTVLCWGYGPLGDGSSDQSAVPVPVVGLTTSINVSYGVNHGCAVLADGTVRCWGREQSGYTHAPDCVPGL